MTKTETQTLSLRSAGRGIREAIRRSNWRKRKQYVVDGALQFRIARQFFAVVLVAMVLGLYVHHVVSWLHALYTVGVLSEPGTHWVEHFLVWVYGLGAIAISVGIFVFVSLFYSHRIAGPAVKITAALQQLAHGSLERPVRLRDTDYLKEVAAAVNQAHRSWNRTIDQVQTALEILREDPEAVDIGTLRQKLEEIDAAIERYKR